MAETTYNQTAPAHGGAQENAEPLRFHETEEHHPEQGTLLGFWL